MGAVIKIAEYRTLPMSEKGLVEDRQDLMNEMEDMLDNAKLESRTLNQDESKRFKDIETEIRSIDDKLEIIDRKRNSSINGKNESEFRTLSDVILPGEKVEKRAYSDNSNSNMDFGKLVKGMAGKGWSGAEREQAHYRAMQSAENNVLIPQILADRIIDVARTKSALFGKVPVVQMDNNNLTVAVQTKDAVANFVNEGDLIPTSEAVFTSVELKGKTLAIFISVSEQLLDSAANLGNQLLYSSAAAIALALDKAMLYGKGTVEGQPVELTGISTYSTINKVTHNAATLDYDLLIKAQKACKSANIQPDNIVYSTNMAADLDMLKDTLGQYVSRPKTLDCCTITESNNVNDNESYCYDSNALLLGLHKGINMQWGYTTDQFQRIQKGLRIYLRADLGVVRPSGITQATFVKTV